MRTAPAVLLATALLAAACQTTGEPPAPSAATGPALAPAEFRPPAPGSFIVGQREDGALTKARILTIEGFAVTLERDGERLTHAPFCDHCGHPRDDLIETGRYAQLWPLEVGKSVTFQRRRARDGATWVHTVSVTGTETVETEAGPFDAYVVEQEVRGAGGNPWRSTRTQWYAPELGWTVRSEWRNSDGEAGSWQLAAIALAQ